MKNAALQPCAFLNFVHVVLTLHVVELLGHLGIN